MPLISCTQVQSSKLISLNSDICCSMWHLHQNHSCIGTSLPHNPQSCSYQCNQHTATADFVLLLSNSQGERIVGIHSDHRQLCWGPHICICPKEWKILQIQRCIVKLQNHNVSKHKPNQNLHTANLDYILLFGDRNTLSCYPHRHLSDCYNSSCIRI